MLKFHQAALQSVTAAAAAFCVCKYPQTSLHKILYETVSNMNIINKAFS